MKIEVTKITVVNTGCADNIYLATNLKNPVWPFQGNAVLRMESTPSKTDSFIKENFPGIEYKKIEG
jgi:hypothetical protein